PARAIDADALQHFLAAGVRLDAERALFERRVQPFGTALDDDIGDALAAELVGDYAADAAVAADDEVILDGFEHAFLPPPLQPLGKAAFHDYRGQQREGIQRRADAGHQHEHRPGLADARQRMDLTVTDRGHRDDRHVERVPEAPAFDR